MSTSADPVHTAHQIQSAIERMDVDALSIRRAQSSPGPILIAARPGLSAMRRRSGRETPGCTHSDVACLFASSMSVVVDTARSSAAMGRTEYGKSAGRKSQRRWPPLRIMAPRSSIPLGRRSCARRAGIPPCLRQTPSRLRVLKRREHVTVRQPCIRMWMAESGDIPERRQDFRFARRGQIVEPGASRVESVREQMPVAGRFNFGVVRMRPGHPRRQRGHDGTVLRRRRRSIDHREEVARLARGIAGPRE